MVGGPITIEEIIRYYGVELPDGVGKDARRRRRNRDTTDIAVRLRRVEDDQHLSGHWRIYPTHNEDGYLCVNGPIGGENSYFAIPQDTLGMVLRRIVDETDYIITSGEEHIPEDEEVDGDDEEVYRGEDIISDACGVDHLNITTYDI